MRGEESSSGKKIWLKCPFCFIFLFLHFMEIWFVLNLPRKLDLSIVRFSLNFAFPLSGFWEISTWTTFASKLPFPDSEFSEFSSLFLSQAIRNLYNCDDHWMVDFIELNFMRATWYLGLWSGKVKDNEETKWSSYIRVKRPRSSKRLINKFALVQRWRNILQGREEVSY